MKTAAASVMSASASAPPMWNRMRKTSAFLRKLSLKAEKNWVQNRGAKRRVISRDEDMAFPPVPMGARPATRDEYWLGLRPLPASGARARAAAAGAARLRDDNLGKRTIAAAATTGRARTWKAARKKNAGGPGPPAAQVPPCSRRYWRRARCHPRSITIAATLKQTAAPHASVNNEIHMATLSDLSSHVRQAAVQLRSRQSVPG